MRLLFGNYELTIDEKNRLLVPSEIRKALEPEKDGEAFFLVTGVNQKLWLYPEKYYESLALRLQSEMAPEEDLLAFDQVFFAQAGRVEWDSQGRILIPEKVLRKSVLSREVTVLGMRDHVEIWNRADWNSHEAVLETRRSEISTRMKQRASVNAKV